MNKQSNNLFEIDPDATEDFGIDWTNNLETDEGIVTSDWTVDDSSDYAPSDATDSLISNEGSNGNVTTVFFSGGTEGETYVLKNTITTDASIPRELVRRIYIKVKKK